MVQRATWNSALNVFGKVVDIFMETEKLITKFPISVSLKRKKKLFLFHFHGSYVTIHIDYNFTLKMPPLEKNVGAEFLHLWGHCFGFIGKIYTPGLDGQKVGDCIISNIHSGHLILALLGFQFLDFWLKPFVDPMPVELWESAIYQKFCLSKLVWLQK